MAFTDDDVLLDPRWLTELVRGFGAGPDVACVTGPIVPRELETPAQIWLEQYGASAGFAQRVYDRRDNRPADPLFPYTGALPGPAPTWPSAPPLCGPWGASTRPWAPPRPPSPARTSPSSCEGVLRGHPSVYQPGAIVYHAHSRDFQRFRRQIYAYGVGLATCVTKSVLDHPGTLPDLLSPARGAGLRPRPALGQEPQEAARLPGRADPGRVAGDAHRAPGVPPQPVAPAARTWGPHQRRAPGRWTAPAHGAQMVTAVTGELATREGVVAGTPAAPGRAPLVPTSPSAPGQERGGVSGASGAGSPA